MNANPPQAQEYATQNVGGMGGYNTMNQGMGNPFAGQGM